MINKLYPLFNPTYNVDGVDYGSITICINEYKFYVAKPFHSVYNMHYGYFNGNEGEENKKYYNEENVYDFNGLIKNIDKVSKKELEHLLSCTDFILNSYSDFSYHTKDLNLTMSDYEELKQYVKYMKDMLNELIKNKSINGKEKKMKWIKPMNLDEVDLNEILNLFSKYFKENKNEKNAEVIYKDTQYKLEYDDNENQYIFKMLVPDDYEDDNNNINNNDDDIIRSIIRLAKMKKCEGLNEFINGNFYPIIRTEDFNNKKYITIKNDRGEERTIREDRFDIVEVYNEPPK